MSLNYPYTTNVRQVPDTQLMWAHIMIAIMVMMVVTFAKVITSVRVTRLTRRPRRGRGPPRSLPNWGPPQLGRAHPKDGILNRPRGVNPLAEEEVVVRGDLLDGIVKNPNLRSCARLHLWIQRRRESVCMHNEDNGPDGHHPSSRR